MNKRRILVLGYLTAVVVLAGIGVVVSTDGGNVAARILMFVAGGALGSAITWIGRSILFSEDRPPPSAWGWAAAGLLGTLAARLGGNSPIAPLLVGIGGFAALTAALLSPRLRAG